jgi:hypothetical protein
MRSAVAILCFCATTSLASPERRSTEFNGVTVSFTLLNPSLCAVVSSEFPRSERAQCLKLRFSLLNQSQRPVVFRYMPLFLMHVDVFTSRGERVDFKNGAPTFEALAAEIPLKPSERFDSIEKICLSIWYDLQPGDYYLTFHYDLRLLPDSVMKIYRKKFHSNDLVPWDTKKYWFHIHP